MYICVVYFISTGKNNHGNSNRGHSAPPFSFKNVDIFVKIKFFLVKKISFSRNLKVFQKIYLATLRVNDISTLEEKSEKKIYLTNQIT